MAFLAIPVNFFRLQAQPLDTTDVYTTYDALTSYVSTSPYMYSGQICTVVDDGAYFVKSDKTVEKLGVGETQQNKQYRSDYVGSSAIYIGSAQIGALETSPVWSVKKSIFSPSGTFTSSVSALNIAWTNRYSL